MKSHLKCRSSWFAVAVVGLFSSFAVQANLIVNGGFEEPLVGGNYVHRNGDELPGWTLFSTYRGTVHFDTVYDPVSEGSQAVQIEVPGDWISQSFATVIGQDYTVSFDLSAYSVYGGPNLGFTPCSPTCSSILGVTVGTTDATFTGSSAGYVTNTLQFTADSSVTTLKFENLYQGDGWGNYPHLDNVSVIGPPPVTTVSIDIEPGGTEQECSEQGGTSVQLTAEVDEGYIASVTWMINDIPAGDTETITPFLELGQHSVQVEVVTDNGATGSATETITVADTAPPQIDAAFFDAKTGQEITQASPADRVSPSVAVTDVCDPEPVINAVVGIPSESGDIFFTNQTPSSTLLRSNTNAGYIELSVSATDASGNTTTENIQLELVK